MSGKRIGERLSGLVPLSGHDIEEILSEQGASGRRFGDIAIQLGLCMPQDVWRAWSSQLADSPQRINLDDFGIDTQALNLVPSHVASRYHVIPIRMLNDELVLACDEAAYPHITTEMMGVLNCKTQFVLSSHAEIAKAIRMHYRQRNDQ